MQELMKYLKARNFESRLKKLNKKLSEKTVIIYGTGKLFQAIQANYDLSKLNIIGITDIKYLPEDEGKEDFGYKIIPYNKFNLLNVDYILIATQNYFSLEDRIKKTSPDKKVLPLLKLSNLSKFIYKLKNVKFIKKLLNSKTNTFVLIKANGQKIYNPKIKKLEIKFWGKNNYIEIHEPLTIRDNLYISCVDNCEVKIEKNNFYKKAMFLLGNSNKLNIGSNTTIEEASILQRNSFNNNIIIGSDCQISYEVIIRSTDGHTIYDKNSKVVRNYTKDVIIGDHVWIGARTMVLKGAQIPSNSIVGACALVNKEFTEENTVLAGIPAKIIKRNVNWDRRGPHEFK